MIVIHTPRVHVTFLPPTTRKMFSSSAMFLRRNHLNTPPKLYSAATMPADSSATAIPWFNNHWHPRQSAPASRILPSPHAPSPPPPPPPPVQPIVAPTTSNSTTSTSAQTVSTFSSIWDRFSLVSFPSSVAEVPQRVDTEDFSPPVPTPPVAVALARRLSNNDSTDQKTALQVRITPLGAAPTQQQPKDIMPIG